MDKQTTLLQNDYMFSQLSSRIVWSIVYLLIMRSSQYAIKPNNFYEISSLSNNVVHNYIPIAVGNFLGRVVSRTYISVFRVRKHLRIQVFLWYGCEKRNALALTMSEDQESALIWKQPEDKKRALTWKRLAQSRIS
ncbi:8749_t:CDS:2 [Dentiscutata erythropus]|uniref:8749_t:CDS:1 n=1 Tax=Dentiscutata erythropus TaxID=1348616 RepID=A0A9N8ZDM5_9GLOM|nr:8749_t:CDS:2 [Dentiscutata erythropus]